MGKRTKTILLAVLVVVFAAACVCFGMALGSRDAPAGQQTEAQTQAKQEVDTDAADWEGEKEVYTGRKNTDTIDIPGYGSISLQAGVTEQKVNFYNPEQNTCYFKMSLLLSDGTLLWESKLIEPGKGIYDITLTRTLDAGTYEDATLKYECFAMDDAQTPLNGSEIKLALNVLE